MKNKIKKFLVDYLLIRDFFNVVQWIASVWIITAVLQWLFGDVNAPSMSMSYVIKSFMAVSSFSIYFVAAWMIMRIFFKDVAGYFMDKTVRITDKDKSTDDEKVYYMQTRYITDLYNVSNSNKPSECFKRLLFHFSVYFFLILAIILSGLTLF